MEIAHEMPPNLFIFFWANYIPISSIFSIGAVGAGSLQWWIHSFHFGVSRCGHLFAARRPQHEQSPVSTKKPSGLFKKQTNKTKNNMSERAWNLESLFVNTQLYAKGISVWKDMISRMGGGPAYSHASPVNDFEQSSAGKVELGPSSVLLREWESYRPSPVSAGIS